MRKILITAITIITAGFSLSAYTKTVRADNQGLVISPSIIDLRLAKGEMHKENIVITNTSDHSIDVDININTTPQLPSNSSWLEQPTKNDLNTFTSLNTNKLHLDAHSQQKISLTIEPGQANTDRSYTGSISITPANPQNVIGSGTQLTLNTILLLDIGKTNPSITPKNFELTKQGENLIFSTTLDNKSPSSAKPKGKIKIYDTWGTLIKTIPINENGLTIIPQSQRMFESTWHIPYGLGVYTAQGEIYYGDPKIKIETPKIRFTHTNNKTPLAAAILITVPTALYIKHKKKKLPKTPR